MYKDCDVCRIFIWQRAYNTEDFLEKLYLFKCLLKTDNFEYVSSNFDLDHPKDDNGNWQEKNLEYTMRCKHCGRKFDLSCNTQTGHASLYVLFDKDNG